MSFSKRRKVYLGKAFPEFCGIKPEAIEIEGDSPLAAVTYAINGRIHEVPFWIDLVKGDLLYTSIIPFDVVNWAQRDYIASLAPKIVNYVVNGKGRSWRQKFLEDFLGQ